MPLTSIIRFFATIISLAILAAAVYLLWSWYQGEVLVDANGERYFVREDWRLWVALALTAWSFLGKFLIVPLIAKPDTDPSKIVRGDGRMIAGPDGSSLYAEVDGAADAPTLVVTHGWSMDSTIWYYLRRDLGSQFRLVTWDLPGMGRSQGAKDKAWNLSAFATSLKAVVEASSEGRKVILVGHSIGGMTIQTLARDYPDYFRNAVAGVVLINTTYTNPLKTMILPRLMQALRAPVLEPAMRLTILLQPLVWLSAWQSYLSGFAHVGNRLGFGRHVTRSQLEHVTLLSTRNPPGNIAKGNIAMMHWDATGALSPIGVPVLVLGGDADIITKPIASQAIVQQTPSAMLRIFGGAGHMGLLEDHSGYNAAVSEFSSQVTQKLGNASPVSAGLSGRGLGQDEL